MWFRDIFNRSPNQPQPAASQGTGPDAAWSKDVRFQPEAIRQMDRLMINASRFLPGYSSGLRSSARRRPQLEFREHRMYTPGDDVRFVDWKASARQEHIFVKQGEHHKEASIFVLLDCSASMGWGEPPKSTTALRLAAILGYLALAHGDRFFLVPFQQQILQPLGPVNGKGQVPQLLNTLRSLPFRGGSDFQSLGPQFRRRYGHTSGLLLVISDFIDLEDPRAFLDRFPAPRWDVVMLHLLHPLEEKPAFSGDYEFQDVETGAAANLDINPKTLLAYQQHLRAWKETLNMACVEKNAFYMHIETAFQNDLQLLTSLREIHLLKPL
jgi:uncharacterized protein (DUF58 family)